MRTRLLPGSLLVLAVFALGACRASEPKSPDTTITSVNAPQPPPLGTGAPRVKTGDAYNVIVAPPVRQVCSGTVPFFEFDSAETRDSDQPSMQVLADCMTKGALVGKSIKLIGRTDPRGTTEYNEKLGVQRAERVKSYLLTHGVTADRLQVESAGEAQASDNPENWPLDRRVEVQLVK